jgi:hypothetical protein
VDESYFKTFGFIVLRQLFDARPLAEEIDQVLNHGLPGSSEVSQYGEIRFQYVPMMSATTPVSLALLDRAAVVASTLLGSAVIPTRAKAVRYFGNTPWHVDSVLPLESIGFAAYLEPVGLENGALRVIPASHRLELGSALREFGAIGMTATTLPSYAVATEPGDMIVFDEHLFHSSFGGGVRRQWRIDFVRDPMGAEAERLTKEYFQGIYAADWDASYDVDRYPSYSDHWRKSGRPAAARLESLGVYELAANQETLARSKRRLN